MMEMAFINDRYLLLIFVKQKHLIVINCKMQIKFNFKTECWNFATHYGKICLFNPFIC